MTNPAEPPREARGSQRGTREHPGAAAAAHRLTIDPALLSRVNTALDAIRAGKMVILVDDEDRENEGDLVMAAECVTPEAINFMAKQGRGLICLTLTEEQVDRLELPLMSAPGRHGPPLGTAFTVSIEARTGVTSGISAADRAHTIKVAVDPEAKASDLVTPGHVFPLRAKRGGVLVRTGHTEGSVDLAALAGLGPAGVICEIMNDDGTMARMKDLEAFAKTFDLGLLTIADLIQYRLQTERLVKRVAEAPFILDETGTEWVCITYAIVGEDREFLALVKGDVSQGGSVLTRVHTGSVLGDVFSSSTTNGGVNLRASLRMIEAEGRGVVLYIPPTGGLLAEMQKRTGAPPVDRPSKPPAHNAAPLREFGLGAQVLADLGIDELRVLSNSPTKIAGLDGFGLKVIETIPLTPKKA